MSVDSRSSFPPKLPPLPRDLPIASISSTKMMHGACFFALAKRSRTREGPTPTNISTNSDPETDRKGTPASPAVALASSVLPVPGGPDCGQRKTIVTIARLTRMAPRGIFAPSFSYLSGSFKNLTNSMISSLASSMPATSLNRAATSSSLLNILALLLPTPKMPPDPPPPPIGDRLMLQNRNPPSKSVGAREMSTDHPLPSSLYCTGMRSGDGMPSSSCAAVSCASKLSTEPIVKWYGAGLLEEGSGEVMGPPEDEDEGYCDPEGAIGLWRCTRTRFRLTTSSEDTRPFDRSEFRLVVSSRQFVKPATPTHNSCHVISRLGGPPGCDIDQNVYTLRVSKHSLHTRQLNPRSNTQDQRIRVQLEPGIPTRSTAPTTARSASASSTSKARPLARGTAQRIAQLLLLPIGLFRLLFSLGLFL